MHHWKLCDLFEAQHTHLRMCCVLARFSILPEHTQVSNSHPDACQSLLLPAKSSLLIDAYSLQGVVMDWCSHGWAFDGEADM